MKIFRILFLALVANSLLSCGDVKHLNYFQNNFDTASIGEVTFPEPRIQKGDLIGISVYSDNAAATALYNQAVSTSSSTTSAGSVAGYLVDNNGNIPFQGVGALKVEGLTKQQVVNLLDSKLKDTLLSNPYYNIRFLNFKVTVVGDVMRPGVFNVPNERVNVLEAIGLAGDLTIYGKRDKITVIREADGRRSVGKLDLTSSEVFASPFFNLQQNDVVIVDASERKAAASDQVTARNISIGTTIASTIAIIISLLLR